MNPSCNPLEVTAAISPLTLEDTSQLFFHMCAGLNTSHDIAAQCLNTSHNIAPQCLNTSHDFAAQCVDPKQHYVNVWLNIDPGASWEKLATGLRKIDKNSLATEIESQKCQVKVAYAGQCSSYKFVIEQGCDQGACSSPKMLYMHILVALWQ